MSSAAPLRLREWLLAQLESGRFPGLRWEDRGQKTFRIPWKHAAKQDYRQHQHAALFRAWAIYKGKYHEGMDKADPSMWKTRLRCALNKSTDFREVPDLSHLDISEPYKVYQVVTNTGAAESQQETDKENSKESLQEPNIPLTSAKERRPNGESIKARRASSHSDQESKNDLVPTGHNSSGVAQASQKTNHTEQQGYQVKGIFYGWSPAQFRCHPSPHFIGPSSQLAEMESINSDCWLHIRLYYCDVLVKEVTTTTAEGCRITFLPVPADNTCLYGPSGMEQIEFPAPAAVAGNCQVTRAISILERLLPFLHRGVLLWVAPEGVFMKRQCQGRVYWKGPMAPHNDKPNKLEREKTYKLLDTQQFLQQLRSYLSEGEPPPQYQIRFCFGEEYPAAGNQKLIMAHVEPVFARDIALHAQQLGPRSLQGSLSCNLDLPGTTQILKQLCGNRGSIGALCFLPLLFPDVTSAEQPG
ncbi:interferon regulatory factor 4-like [Sceloporus undulatus]|uniref:interferon regulatory factor 4-like n=1 Tax=Sceloporus undulatus TaxID=8520 RepID=UPI001C4CB305|nr:interferon regulatory factor 4-like [Sceloporus undulatus]